MAARDVSEGLTDDEEETEALATKRPPTFDSATSSARPAQPGSVFGKASLRRQRSAHKSARVEGVIAWKDHKFDVKQLPDDMQRVFGSVRRAEPLSL